MAASLDELIWWARPSAEYCVEWAESQGVRVTVTSVKRTRARQAALYRRYLQGKSQFPAAPPGESAHEWGMAWDSVVDEHLISWWKQVRRILGWRVPDSDWIHAVVPEWRLYADPAARLRIRR